MNSQHPSRRNFLNSSTLAAGAAATGALNIARSAHAAGSDVIKIALIGCGGRGNGAVANCLNVQNVLNERIKLVAIADAFEDRAAAALANLKKDHSAQVDVPSERVFVGLDAYQKAIDSDVDVVLLTTPPGFRPIHYAAAVKAGKHVFMEKPCCTDAPGYRSLIESNKLADEKNLKVVVGLQRRPRRELSSGNPGDPRRQTGRHSLPADLLEHGSGGGGRDLGPRPQNAPDEMAFQIRNWGCFRLAPMATISASSMSMTSM